MRKIDTIIIHCSDSDYPHHDDVSVIRQWHVNERGFRDVGYHYFIRKDGLIQPGRKEADIGAHCEGKNGTSIGICLHGKKEFTQSQFISLANIINSLAHKYPIKVVEGHNFFNKNKTCPNFNVREFKEKYGITI